MWQSANLFVRWAIASLLFTANTVAQVAVEQNEEPVLIEAEIADYEAEMERDAALQVDQGEADLGWLPVYLAVERAFVSRVCDLDALQKQQLEKMDRTWLKRVASEKQKGVGPSGADLIGALLGLNTPRQGGLSHVVVRGRIDRELNSLLTENQKAAYNKEKQSRKQFRDEANTDAFIEALQDRLNLSDKQREDLKGKMLPWVSRNPPNVTLLFGSTGHYPRIPIHLLAALTDEQRKTYRQLPLTYFSDHGIRRGDPPALIEE